MHDDPTIHLWMLQNALTTFMQTVHRAPNLFLRKNYCQGIILDIYFQLATTVSPQTRRWPARTSTL